MGKALDWRHLIDAARLLARQGGVTVRGRPRQTMLNRAMSAVYYSMFHALCRSNANALIGASSRRVHQPAWARAHRALDHGFAREHLQ